MKQHVLLAALCLTASACHPATQPQPNAPERPAGPPPSALEALHFGDAPATAAALAPPANLAIEVALDRLGFSSGVIDGKLTRFDTAALRAWQSARGLTVTGQPDKATLSALGSTGLPALRTVSIPAAFAAGPFAPTLPRQTAAQAGVERLAYRDLGEALAERFHTSPALLVALNPAGTRFAAGSAHDPLPLGTWSVLGVSRNPDYHFNPALFRDAADDQPERLLKPGPNSPVGVVWIDLSKEHYGIHGTPEPALIGHTESHGCVRLTNWDAARLAQMVGPGVTVVFEA